MAVTVIDGSKSPEKCGRVLGYDNASELTGHTVVTDNAGTIECEAGTMAIKFGGTKDDVLWLNHSDQWIPVIGGEE